MNKKLHRVEVVLYVMAEDEFEACWAATNARFDVFECVAEATRSLDPGWEEAVPYNSEDERTCAEILADRARPNRTGVRSMKSAALRPRTRMCRQRQAHQENTPGVMESD